MFTVVSEKIYMLVGQGDQHWRNYSGRTWGTFPSDLLIKQGRR